MEVADVNYLVWLQVYRTAAKIAPIFVRHLILVHRVSWNIYDEGYVDILEVWLNVEVRPIIHENLGV